MSIRIRRPPSSNNSWADLQIKLFIDDLERNFNKFVEETADGAINLFATNGSFSGTLDAPSGTFGTITAGLLQGTNLLIDLDATGTDPVIQHDAFVLYGNGSLVLGGDAVISGPALSIDLAATGTDPVLSHAAFVLNADGSAEFGGEVTATDFTGVSADFSSGLLGLGTPNVSGIGSASITFYAGNSSDTILYEDPLYVSPGGLQIGTLNLSTLVLGDFWMSTNQLNPAFGANDSAGAGNRTVAWTSPNV